ncbi:ABC transporter permease [Rhodobacter sp. 24-YEA-8]|uniref:ABC transporter permease n=1 Tax=Rhodobacter sp. 24-YEA-8 TaxID=1884310 RepID=UPI0008945F4A|nr:ABC transporter permease subunit [Rhodobacter sp. 24-YEA-8]SEC32442.1 amino acid ABC transporter membrane protein 2, PAAT family [Rhodobacter sp. 24-YEA-8]
MKALLQPHRIIMMLIAAGLVLWICLVGRWDWLGEPKYQTLILQGIWRTIWLMALSVLIGFTLAVPLGLAQASGPWYLAMPARAFCTVIRGTPLLLQIWLLYYGLGSLFPGIPWIRESELWPVLRQAWPYALLALSLSYAGYEGEVMRGAFASVPRGQIEAARAMGMPRHKILTRISFPQALQSVLPTLGGETVLQLKATPLVATITVLEIYAASSRVRQDLLITYEPLFFVAAVYLALAGVIVLGFGWLESRRPRRTA